MFQLTKLGLVFALAVCLAIVQGAEPPPVDVCEVLKDRANFNGKTIAIQGILDGGEHGSWLVGESCSPTINLDGVEWPTKIFIVMQGETGRTDHPPGTHLRVVYSGQFVTKGQFLPYERNGKRYGDGFGPGAGFPGQVIVTKVIQVEIVDESGRTRPLAAR